MATETLRPDGELSDSGLVASDYTDHDEDPDVSSVTINATGNNVSTEYGVDFPTPTGAPNVGADLQEFRVGVIEFDGGQSGTPQARIELWENGSLVRAGSDVNVSVYAVLSFTWNANELGTADGSLVQCKVIGTKSGGSPGARNTVRIGHIEWNADYSAGASFTPEADEFGFFEDGTEAGAALVYQSAPTNSNIWRNHTIAADQPFHLRWRAQETAGGPGLSTDDWGMEIELNESATWNTFNASSSYAQAVAGAATDGEVTTNRLAAGSGSFVAGALDEVNGSIENIQLTANNYNNLVFSGTLIEGDLSSGDRIRFRLTLNGTPITNSVTPTIQVTTGPVLRDWAQGYDGTADDIVEVTHPDTVVENDFQVVVAQLDNQTTGSFDTISGWADEYDELSQTILTGVFSRFAPASPPATTSFTTTGASGPVEDSVGFSFRFDGVDPTTPIDVLSTMANGSSDTPASNGVTTTGLNDFILNFVSFDGNDFTENIGPPTGTMDHVKGGERRLGSGGSSGGFWAGGVKVTAGGTGTATWPSTTVVDGWHAFQIAIQLPAAAGVDIAVPLKAYTKAGQIPIVGSGASVVSLLKAFSLTEQIPAVGTGVLVENLLKNYTRADFIPEVKTGVSISVPLGAFTLTGFIPTVGTGVDIASLLKTYSLTKFIPTVTITSGGVDIAVPLGAFTLSSFLPVINIGVNINSLLKTYSLTGFIPLAASGVNVSSPSKAFNLTGNIPVVGIGVNVVSLLKAFNLNSFIPALATGVNIVSLLKTFTLTGFIPSFGSGIVVNVPVKAFNSSFNIPIIGTGVDVQAPSNSFVLSFNDPSIASGVGINVLAKGFTRSEFIPVITATELGGVEILPGVKGYNIAFNIPAIDLFIPPIIIDVPGKEFNLQAQIPDVYSVASLERFARHINLTPPFDVNQRRYLIENFGLTKELLEDGFTGQFTTTDGKTVLVRNGVITNMY